MEVSSSAVTGVVRIGLQVVSSHKGPMIEIYHQVRNRMGPEQELRVPSGSSGKIHIEKHRFQDQFIQFYIVNIGGVRAENIKLSITGELKRNSPREGFGEMFDVIHPQLAPGQIHFLFMFDIFDLNEYPEGGGKPLGLKSTSLTITAEYDGPAGILNWLASLPSKLRGKRRYKSTYTFFPTMVSGDLPPMEY